MGSSARHRRSTGVRHAHALVLLGAALCACSEDTTLLTPGVLGGPCYGNATCNPGLACEADRCVARADAGVDDAGPRDAASALDAGTSSTGAVFGRIVLSGEADHSGAEITVAGRAATTDAAEGSHRLEVRLGPAPEPATSQGRVVPSSGPLPADVHVYLQAAPAGWIPASVTGVVVFAGRDTEVETLTLEHPSPFARHVPVDASGAFTLEAVTGHFEGARPEQPTLGTGRYVQPLGTFAVAAGSYPFVDAPSEEGDQPRISGFDFTWSFEDSRGWSADPAWAWTQTLDVGAAPATLDDLVLYPAALLFGTEGQPFWYAGLDLSAQAPVPSSSPDADLTLEDAEGPFAPTRTVRLAAPGIQLTDAPNMQELLQAPAAGYDRSVSLTYETYTRVFTDRALDRVYALRTLEGDYAKLKVRYGLQATGADNVWSLVFVLYHHEPGGGAAFAR